MEELVRTIKRSAGVLGVVLVLGIAVMGGCENLFTDNGGDQQNHTTGEVRDLAQGLFGVAQTVIQFYYLIPDGAVLETVENGWNLVFDNTVLPDGAINTLDGTISIRVPTDNPFTIQVTIPEGEPLSLTYSVNDNGPLTDTITMDLTATWAAGHGFSDEPQSLSGWITVDGVTYDEFADVTDLESLPVSVGLLFDNVIGAVLPLWGYRITQTMPSDWDHEWNVAFHGYTPPGETSQVDGVLAVGITEQPLFRIDVVTDTPITLTGHRYSTVSVQMFVEWEPDKDPGDGPPRFGGGTITVDGTSYDVASLLELDTAPTPLPETFRTATGTFEQTMTDRVWRKATGNPAEPWSHYNYMTALIHASGSSHIFQRSEQDDMTGGIDWQNGDSGTPRIEFMNDAGGWGIGFDVLDYSANHLHLRTSWGDAGTREWIFSAGTDNLSGILATVERSYAEGSYRYYPPLNDVTLELHYEENPGEGVPADAPALDTAITDSRGFFAFETLSSYGIAALEEGLFIRVLLPGGGTVDYRVMNDRPPGETNGDEPLFAFITVGP